MKKKLDEITKAKLIYSGELLIFSIIFLTLALLMLFKILNKSDTFQLIFNWVTIFGAPILIGDFLWAIFSKRRRKKVCLLDKILVLPLAIYLLAFDIICFVINRPSQDVYQICIPIAFLYITIVYGFEAIYHYKHPIPGLLDDIKEEEEKNGKN